MIYTDGFNYSVYVLHYILRTAHMYVHVICESTSLVREDDTLPEKWSTEGINQVYIVLHTLAVKHNCYLSLQQLSSKAAVWPG